VSEKRPDGVGVNHHLSYLALKAGYQRLRAAPSFEVARWSTQVHPNRAVFLGHLITESFLFICRQKWEEIQEVE
jgi:hypothetical protein